MKKAFSLLEIIFVLLILGILAAISIPVYFQMQAQSAQTVAKAFAATLTRTTGHTLWAKSIFAGGEGSLKSDNDNNPSTFYGNNLNLYITIPQYFDKSSVNFDNCAKVGEVAQPFIAKNVEKGGEYNIFCRDGNKTDAPKFVSSKQSSYNF
ncbi:type II secretion system protein [Nitratiruptor sp. YY09-18]|uniref:type II secretion system protein n=1 Tax=Nitratiruptor sp. YY09-18 TaxID=2724901 RepID=UPI001914DBEC|nr:prepilin-type N-terminal cleavage/methylation domain-containing protein [Nitratiruptor sp. YY09-18]BCD67464.1 hypothetical protein NitYY0918_C0357 [Nitratiruptor sp. YY09-18]